MRITTLSQFGFHSRYHKMGSKICRRCLPTVFIVVVLLFTSFYFYVNMNISKEVMSKSLFIIALCIYFTYLFTCAAQNLIDESEQLYLDLCACPWFLWNKSNKSIYFMFLIHAKEPLTVRSFGLEYSYAVIVRLAKTTMSLLTALQELTS
ncbi:uncharacterized protein LOC123318210 [Coccinella septempunctata]|uniref:uncharacterized protein LOC123318210 n=1 Tax=Coccinella septempunctata TaxID=41139 RepID=UPI001D0709DE|nr:uncharacterized protein LOC123318210 [Coccinella septempunctata]